MQIGFYIHHTALKAGGIFTYSVGILKLLLSAEEITKIFLIIDKKQLEYFNDFSKHGKVEIILTDRSNIFFKIRFVISYFLLNIFIYLGTNKLPRARLLWLKNLSFLINPYKKLLEQLKIALFHVPLQYAPIYGGKIPIITTMHDFQEHHFPEFFSKKEKRHRRVNNKKAVYESDHIIVSFDHVKEDLIKFYKIKEEKISVCPPPFADDWFTSKEETNWHELEAKYKLRKNYLLYPAATWKHKNHITLLNTLKKLRDNGNDIELVCTGMQTEYFGKIKSIIRSLNLSLYTHFLGIVSEADLIGLYKNSSLVVIPTLYEAGSGPLYEAMRYKVPVICSNVTSLPGTMGNNDFTFDPNNVDEITLMIKKILSEKLFRERNLENSECRIKYYSHLNKYNCFIKVYRLTTRTRVLNS